MALDAIEVAFEPCGVRVPGLENDFAANKPHLADITILADEPSEIERRIEMMFARLYAAGYIGLVSALSPEFPAAAVNMIP